MQMCYHQCCASCRSGVSLAWGSRSLGQPAGHAQGLCLWEKETFSPFTFSSFIRQNLLKWYIGVAACKTGYLTYSTVPCAFPDCFGFGKWQKLPACKPRLWFGFWASNQQAKIWVGYSLDTLPHTEGYVVYRVNSVPVTPHFTARCCAALPAITSLQWDPSVQDMLSLLGAARSSCQLQQRAPGWDSSAGADRLVWLTAGPHVM